ncbi:MAG: apolipoprotein N-acyltransferase [Holosporaceae bacterium]|nr:apolipoprotein N-acyltransferase [Holosporaceae bacterium]
MGYAFFGMIAALGFAPINLFPAFILAMAWFFAQTQLDNDCAFFDAFIFFLFMHVAGLYWLVYPLTLDIITHGWLIPVAVILVPAYFALQLSIGWLLAKHMADGILNGVILYSSFSCIIMYIYGHFSFGFPWLLPAYIWGCHEIFLQTICLYGTHGLNLTTMAISCLCGTSFVFYKKNDRPKAVAFAVVAAGLLITMTLFGIFRTLSHETSWSSHRARLVQCNLAQQKKNNPKLSRENLQEHLNLSHGNSNVEFVVWPEASIPYLYQEKLEWFHDLCRKILAQNVYLVAGAVRQDIVSSKIYNSIVTIDHLGKNVLNYDKRRLVPFGEYVPFRGFIPSAFQSIASSIGDFDLGESPKILAINGLNFLLNICYEAAFPENFFPENGPLPDAIINVTNDAWFGYTSEPYQHLLIVRCRSIETGLPLMRCANYGISAVFDGCGRELSRIDINTAGAMDFFIPHKIAELPTYAQYGDTIFWLMILALLLISGISSLKNVVGKIRKRWKRQKSDGARNPSATH